MRPLLELEQRHPAASTIVGSISGVASWILSHTADITAVAGMIGAICTAVIAAVAVVAKIINLVTTFRRWARNRDQRRRHFRDAPFDEGEDGLS